MANFVSLQTSLTGIRAAQAGIDVTSHNIANANTTGYTRQRVLQQARPPWDSPNGPMGTGTDVTAVQRLRDSFLDARVRTTSADAAFDRTLSGLLGRVEQITGEPDAGIAVELDEVWASFEDLANEPDSPAARRQVVSALGTLSARFNSVAGGWDTLASDTRDSRDAHVAEVNELLTSVADIDRRLMNAGDRATPPDLLDDRDRMLDRIAEVTGASVTPRADGTVTVQLNGQTLLDGATANRLQVTSTDDLQVVDVASGSTTTVTARGDLGAFTSFLQTELPAQRSALDTVARSLADALNAQHAAGLVHPSGAAGAPLMSYDAANPLGIAATLRVAITDPDQLATAGGVNGGGTTDPFDGRNAQALADLRTADTGTGSLQSQYRGLVVDLGARVAGATRSARSREELHHAADQARVSVTSVSLDEEMVNLVNYQRALEAASRVMTTVDQALDVLVNRTGVVGR